MTLEMQSVLSSQVESIGYDDDTHQLVVDFVTTGRRVAYLDVPSDVASSVINDPVSVGRALNQLVKPRYAWEYR